jgi:hypothetical protein
VYNLTIATAHTYFVGGDGYLVHNQCDKKFTPDQNALIQLAKEAKRKGGLPIDEAETLLRWANELGVPCRGPEVHPNRNFSIPHIHIGPVDHIPIKL